jgi:type I restriction enzyme S subunit
MNSSRQTLNLAACADFQEGYVNPAQGTPGYFDGDVKWLRAVDLNDGFVWNTSRTLTREGFKSAGKAALLFEPDTIAISKSGTIGRLGILKDRMCGNRAVINIRPKPDICDMRYLFFALKFAKEEILTRAEGSVQQNLYISALSSISISLPPLTEQREIAATLGALDDKIEVNRKASATLEAMARALYRSWFVDFDPVWAKLENRPPAHMDPATAALFPDSFDDEGLPLGWRFGTLGELLTLNYGKALKKEQRVAGAFPVYGSGGSDTTHETALIEEPTIIVGRKGTVGSLRWAPNGCWPIDTAFYVTSPYPLSFIYQTLQVLPLSEMNTDAAVPGLNRENAYRLELPFPGGELINAFESVAGLWQRKVDSLTTENQTLSTLRDSLLPRLMSGELRVGDTRAPVEEVA